MIPHLHAIPGAHHKCLPSAPSCCCLVNKLYTLQRGGDKQTIRIIFYMYENMKINWYHSSL